MASLLARVVREGLLIGYSLVALFLLIALLSYSPSDPSWTNGGGADADVANAVGTSGAWISDVLLQVLGLLAYTLPLFLLYKVALALRGTADEQSRAIVWPLVALKLGGFGLLLLSACGLAALHIKAAGALPSAGGILGTLVLDLTVPVLANLGATLLLFAVFLFGLTVTVDISWLGVIDKLGEWTLSGYASSVERLRAWAKARKETAETKERLTVRKKAIDIHEEKQKKRVPPTIKIDPPKPVERSKRVEQERQGTLFADIGAGELPQIGLLDAWQETNDSGFSKESLELMSRLLESKLKDFGIDIEVTAVNPGPVITRFEVQPAPGIKVSRISNLVKDLARSLAIVSVRVVEVIPGKTA